MSAHLEKQSGMTKQQLQLDQKKFELVKLKTELRKLERQVMGCSLERLASLKQAITERQIEVQRLNKAINRLEADIVRCHPE